MANLMIAIALIVTLIAGIAIGRAYSEFKNMRARIAALEAAQAKRLPYYSNEEIENAFAALNAMEFEIAFKKDLIENAKAHLGNARNGRSKPFENR